MQIGHVQRVAQDEVAVKAHEGAGVDHQRGHPAGGGQYKHGAAQRALGQQRPQEGGPDRDHQLRGDAGGGHLQALITGVSGASGYFLGGVTAYVLSRQQAESWQNVLRN